jgi:acyl carrier protein
MSSVMTTQTTDVLERLARRMPQWRHLSLRLDQSLMSLAMDSIDLVELLCAIESEFGVRLSDDDLESAVTVGQLIERIEQLRNHARTQS